MEKKNPFTAAMNNFLLTGFDMCEPSHKYVVIKESLPLKQYFTFYYNEQNKTLVFQNTDCVRFVEKITTFVVDTGIEALLKEVEYIPAEDYVGIMLRRRGIIIKRGMDKAVEVFNKAFIYRKKIASHIEPCKFKTDRNIGFECEKCENFIEGLLLESWSECSEQWVKCKKYDLEEQERAYYAYIDSMMTKSYDGEETCSIRKNLDEKAVVLGSHECEICPGWRATNYDEKWIKCDYWDGWHKEMTQLKKEVDEKGEK